MLNLISSDDIELKFDRLVSNRIGGGGFSNIYHIFYREKDAVLKQLREEDSKKSILKMRREAEIMLSFENHPNICQCFGILYNDPLYSSGIVLEYCVGSDLQNLMNCLKIQRITVETMTVLGWCHQISATMLFISKTYVHADLKPLNILIKEHVCVCRESEYRQHFFDQKSYQLCVKCRGVHREQITLKITDFGLSFPKDEKHNNVGGTLTYRAPETLSGNYSEKSDVYAFGYIMFYLVLGEPYRTKEDGQIVFLKFNKVALDTSDCSSKSIAKLIQECTQDDPLYRPNFNDLTTQLRQKFITYEKLVSNVKQRRTFQKERDECKRIYQNLLPSISTETMQTIITISEEGDEYEDLSEAEFEKIERKREEMVYHEIMTENLVEEAEVVKPPEKKRLLQFTSALTSRIQRFFRQ